MYTIAISSKFTAALIMKYYHLASFVFKTLNSLETSPMYLFLT